MTFPRPAGVLLTGGSSRRMGRDKATLPTGDRTWAARLGALLAGCTDRAIEVGQAVSGLEAVPDDMPGQGPLAALATGWEALGQGRPPHAVVVLATDLPWLGPAGVSWLAGWPAAGSLVPLVSGRPQPLCARWSSQALARTAELVAAGERSMRSLIAGDDVTLADERVWAQAVGAREFCDVDTPDQLHDLPERGLPRP